MEVLIKWHLTKNRLESFLFSMITILLCKIYMERKKWLKENWPKQEHRYLLSYSKIFLFSIFNFPEFFQILYKQTYIALIEKKITFWNNKQRIIIPPLWHNSQEGRILWQQKHQPLFCVGLECLQVLGLQEAGLCEIGLMILIV